MISISVAISLSGSRSASLKFSSHPQSSKIVRWSTLSTEHSGLSGSVKSGRKLSETAEDISTDLLLHVGTTWQKVNEDVFCPTLVQNLVSEWDSAGSLCTDLHTCSFVCSNLRVSVITGVNPGVLRGAQWSQTPSDRKILQYRAHLWGRIQITAYHAVDTANRKEYSSSLI